MPAASKTVTKRSAKYALCELKGDGSDPDILELFKNRDEAKQALADKRAEASGDKYRFVAVPFSKGHPLFPPGVRL